MLSFSLLQLVTSLSLLFNNVNCLPALGCEFLGQPIVDLGYSQYQGTTLSSGVNQYLGMRFAAPPVGDLRFRAPAEPLETTGLQNATAVCSLCHLLASSWWLSSFNLSVSVLASNFHRQIRPRIVFLLMFGGPLLLLLTRTFLFGFISRVEVMSRTQMQITTAPQ